MERPEQTLAGKSIGSHVLVARRYPRGFVSIIVKLHRGWSLVSYSFVDSFVFFVP